MAKTTGVELLSALRKSGSYTLLREIPESFFIEDDEREAFTWLKEYVSTYHEFPQASTFKRETGITLFKVKEPVTYYVNRARERALYYSLTNKFSTLREAMTEKRPDDAVSAAKEMVLLSNHLNVTNGNGVANLSSAIDEVFADQDEARWSVGLRGLPTGWNTVDRITGGWQNGDLITLVGRPGTGKTYMLLHTAHAAWMAGYSVMFVSMEMTVLPLARRLFGIHTGVNPDTLKQRLSTDIVRSMRADAAEMVDRGVPFNFIAGNFKKSIDVVRGAIDEHMPDLICVDASYLLTPQKKRSGSGSRREVVSDVIEELGAITKEVNRPLVNTVQFNRQAVRRNDRRGGDSAAQNPLAHLGLHNIGETDVVGQVSAIVIGMEKYEAPHESTRRYLGFLKGREGEQGHLVINYQFSPRVDFSVIPRQQLEDESGEAPIDLNFEG